MMYGLMSAFDPKRTLFLRRHKVKWAARWRPLKCKTYELLRPEALGQFYCAFVPTPLKCVRQIFRRVCAFATSVVFAGATSIFVRVLLEVRTFLPGLL